MPTNEVLSVARAALSRLDFFPLGTPKTFLNMVCISLQDGEAKDLRNMSDVAEMLSNDLENLIPLKYWTILDSAGCKLVKEDTAARVIQHQWHLSISDPGRVMCQTRLLTEFEELSCC
jgi:hypothetical protein